MKQIRYWLGILLTVGSGLFTLLGFLANSGFFFNTLAHFRVQYALVAGAGLLLLIFSRNKIWSGVASVVLVTNLWLVVPLYFPPITSESNKTDRSASLLLINVLSSNRNAEAVRAEIDRFQPDVLVLEEIIPYWFTALSGLSAEYPYQIHEIREDNFGIWVLSKRPLFEERVIHGGPGQLPMIVCQYPVGNTFLEIVALHPMSPASPRGVRWRNEQLREVIRHYQGFAEPLLLIGDLNTTSFAPIFSELTQQLNLKDSQRGFGPQPSWPAASVSPLMITLDHVLVSPEVQVIDRKTGNNIGSDHLPVYMELAF